MKVPEIFAQLVKGYKKVTGRNPEGLDLIRIRQESLRRFQDMNKVVDMQTGKSIDPSKPIMGGTQEIKEVHARAHRRAYYAPQPRMGRKKGNPKRDV